MNTPAENDPESLFAHFKDKTRIHWSIIGGEGVSASDFITYDVVQMFKQLDGYSADDPSFPGNHLTNRSKIVMSELVKYSLLVKIGQLLGEHNKKDSPEDFLSALEMMFRHKLLLRLSPPKHA